MARRHITTGSPMERDLAYARAVVVGPWCFVSGTTGYDYATMTMPPGALDQARNALATIGSVLGEAGFAMGDVVRVQYTVSDAAFAAQIAPALREAFAHVRPAATMVVAGLVAPQMKVEIEVTALKDAG